MKEQTATGIVFLVTGLYSLIGGTYEAFSSHQKSSRLESSSVEVISNDPEFSKQDYLDAESHRTYTYGLGATLGAGLAVLGAYKIKKTNNQDIMDSKPSYSNGKTMTLLKQAEQLGLQVNRNTTLGDLEKMISVKLNILKNP